MLDRSLQAVAQLRPSAFDPPRDTYQVGVEDGVGVGAGVGVAAGVAVGVGAGLGVGVGVGAGVGVGLGVGPRPTTTLCSTLADCPSVSPIVRRTYLVPTSRKVKLMVTPPPRIEPSASSDHTYEQGVA
jgi:hypothetical protein